MSNARSSLGSRAQKRPDDRPAQAVVLLLVLLRRLRNSCCRACALVVQRGPGQLAHEACRYGSMRPARAPTAIFWIDRGHNFCRASCGMPDSRSHCARGHACHPAGQLVSTCSQALQHTRMPVLWCTC